MKTVERNELFGRTTRRGRAASDYDSASDQHPDRAGAALAPRTWRSAVIALVMLLGGSSAVVIAVAFDYFSKGQAGFGHKQMVLSALGLGIIAWGVELWTAAGLQAIRAWLAEVRQLSLGRAAGHALVAAQLGVVIYVMREVRLENEMLWDRVAILLGAGFLVNLIVPPRRRLAFFAGLSLLGVYAVFGATDGAWLVGAGLGLIALCHVPVPYWWRVALVLAAAGLLVTMRAQWLAAPWSGLVWPILGSMFMFRLMVYLYDLRHSKEPMGVARSVSYFFLLPNLVFPLFPVVDFATFRRTYYDRDDLVIYGEGVQWMARGIVHLLLYRIIYQYLVLAPLEVDSTATLVQYVVANFLLYLRVSGQFHLIVGMLHLFGFRLPETHRFFYLASSFTDFWRRINIYWKDFMMKLFYYPAYFRLKKHTSETLTLVLATMVVFAGTWFLHGVQWFWILGKFLLSWTDAAFWAVLGAVLVASSLYEVKHGRARSLAKREWTMRQAAMHASRVTGTFIFISVLWSIWTSHTFGAWFAMIRAAHVTVPGLAAAVAGVYLVAFASTVLFRRSLTTTPTIGSVRPPRWLVPGTLAAMAPLAAVILLVQPELSSGLPMAAQQAVHTMRLGELNRRDAALLQQGYYENLNANNFSSQLWSVYSSKPDDWVPLWETEAAILTGGFERYRLKPSTTTLFHGEPLTTNSHGMRDREYTLAKPEGVIRVALMGPSYVMGDGVADDQVFDNILEDRLNRERAEGEPRIEILNFSRSGFKPTQQLWLLQEKVAAFDPDIVILVSERYNDMAAIGHIAGLVRDQIPIPYEFMREIVAPANLTPEMSVDAVTRAIEPYAGEMVARTYAAIGAEGRRRNYRMYWLYLATPNVVETPENVEPLVRWAREAGMQPLDLSDIWTGQDLTALQVAPWDHHPNALGHRMIADRLYDVLSGKDLFAAPPRLDGASAMAAIETINGSGGQPDMEGL